MVWFISSFNKNKGIQMISQYQTGRMWFVFFDSMVSVGWYKSGIIVLDVVVKMISESSKHTHNLVVDSHLDNDNHTSINKSKYQLYEAGCASSFYSCTKLQLTNSPTFARKIKDLTSAHLLLSSKNAWRYSTLQHHGDLHIVEPHRNKTDDTPTCSMTGMSIYIGLRLP